MYNEYEQYSALAEDTKNFTKNKINADIDTLNNLSDFKDVNEFVSKNYGDVPEEGLMLEFPNDIKVAIDKTEKTIEIVAAQGEYVIFSKGWRLVPKEDSESQSDKTV